MLFCRRPIGEDDFTIITNMAKKIENGCLYSVNQLRFGFLRFEKSLQFRVSVLLAFKCIECKGVFSICVNINNILTNLLRYILVRLTQFAPFNLIHLPKKCFFVFCFCEDEFSKGLLKKSPPLILVRYKLLLDLLFNFRPPPHQN